MSIKINLTKVKGSEFEGTVSDRYLTDEQLEILGLKRDPHFETELKVCGDYVVEWDHDIPMPQIENIQIEGAFNGGLWNEYRPAHYTDLNTRILNAQSVPVQVPSRHTLDLDLDTVDFESLEASLADSDGGDWAVDRQAAAVDRAYDMMRDGD